MVTPQCNPSKQCVTVHPVAKFRSCHKAIMVITGRAHCSIQIYVLLKVPRYGYRYFNISRKYPDVSIFKSILYEYYIDLTLVLFELMSAVS